MRQSEYRWPQAIGVSMMSTARAVKKNHPCRVIIVSVAMFREALELSLGPGASATKSDRVRRNARHGGTGGTPVPLWFLAQYRVALAPIRIGARVIQVVIQAAAF